MVTTIFLMIIVVMLAITFGTQNVEAYYFTPIHHEEEAHLETYENIDFTPERNENGTFSITFGENPFMNSNETELDFELYKDDLLILNNTITYSDGLIIDDSTRIGNQDNIMTFHLSLSNSTNSFLAHISWEFNILWDSNDEGGYLVSLPIVEEISSGGCSIGDCTPPTFGKLESGVQFVDVGFQFGDKQFSIEKYHVETPLIKAKVAYPYTLKAKVYENNGDVKQFGIGFGVPNEPHPSYSKALAYVEFDKDNIQDIEYILSENDNDDLFNIISNRVTEETCNNETTQMCQVFIVQIVFKQKIEHEPMIIRTIDYIGNSRVNILNDGLVVSGKSINLTPTYKVFDRYERDILKTITISDRTLEDLTIATDEFGMQWNLLDGFWVRDSPETVTSDTDPNSRNSDFFKQKMIHEIIKANNTMTKFMS